MRQTIQPHPPRCERPGLHSVSAGAAFGGAVQDDSVLQRAAGGRDRLLRQAEGFHAVWLHGHRVLQQSQDR